jgi:hypothetical protein
VRTLSFGLRGEVWCRSEMAAALTIAALCQAAVERGPEDGLARIVSLVPTRADADLLLILPPGADGPIVAVGL